MKQNLKTLLLWLLMIGAITAGYVIYGAITEEDGGKTPPATEGTLDTQGP